MVFLVHILSYRTFSMPYSRRALYQPKPGTIKAPGHDNDVNDAQTNKEIPPIIAPWYSI